MKHISFIAIVAASVLTNATLTVAADRDDDTTHLAVNDKVSTTTILSDLQADAVTAGMNHFALIPIDLSRFVRDDLRQKYLNRLREMLKNKGDNRAQQNVRVITNRNQAVFEDARNAAARQSNFSRITTEQYSAHKAGGGNNARISVGNYSSVRQ